MYHFKFQIILENRINKNHFKRESDILSNVTSILSASALMS